MDAEAAAEKGSKSSKRSKLGSWIRSGAKKEVILKAQRDKCKVHFATLMKLCHLKNAELEPKFRKYRGRVALRGDIVKDDSGLHAVFF